MYILDCTLRDGGYYNNWDFDIEVVNAYLAAVNYANIDYVELGLRNFPKNNFSGAFAYTTESYLNSLDLPSGIKYGVMVDAKTILESGYTISEAIDKLFVPANQSKIELVRIAAHFHEVAQSGEIVKKLKSLGYIVGFNLMQAGGKPSELITNMASLASSWDALDVLYFADSLGNMNSDEVTRIVKALRKSWMGAIGIHTHDNMGKGLDNTLTALRNDVTWVDSTVTGMGRGAGNTQTERLLAVLESTTEKYNPKPIYELVIRYFESMQRNYGWGTNLLYFLGAQNDVHPTYIQNLLSNTHYGTDEIVGAIDYLSKLDSTASYNGEILNTAISFSENGAEVSGTDSVKGLFNSKDILIVTNAPNTKKYLKAIISYIEEYKPVVVSININDYLESSLIDYYVISHNSKFLSDAKKYKNINKPIILPIHRFSDKELAFIDELEIYNYGLELTPETLISHDYYGVIPADITLAYLLTVILESSPKSISAVGLDGYDKHDARQQEMIKIFDLYSKNLNNTPIVALTETSYPLEKGSIYAPNI